MSKILKPILLVTAALTLSGVAMAGPKADVNQDGQITKAEFLDAANAKFILADTDFDGNLTQDELKTLREARSAEREAKRFEKQDLNGDGAITQEEISQAKAERKAKRAAKRLEKQDTDGNGVLDDAEKEVAKAARKAKRAEYGSSSKGKRGDKAGKKIKRDANDDGVISRAEFDAANEALFARMDANGDGVLTKGEGPRGRKGKRGKKYGSGK